MERTLGRILLVCDTLLVWIAVLATFALMMLTAADAACRYLFNSPITGAYEIAEKYLMVAGVFLGLSYAYRAGIFIRVTFLVDRLPPRAQLAAEYAAQIVSIVYCGLLIVASGQQAVRGLGEGTTLSALPIPLGPAYFLVPVGLFAMAVLMLLDLPQIRRRKSRLLTQDTVDG